MKIKKKDAAIIFSPDGEITIAVPTTDPVPYHVMYVTALAVLLTEHDKSLYRLVNKKIKEFYKLVEDIVDEED